MSSIEPLHRPGADIDDLTKSAFEILHYNQNLIQFADGKANTLIVINSIALASATASSGLMGLKMAFLLASVLSILLCLAVVVSRADADDEARRRDHIFFGDIMARSNGEQYAYEYVRTEPRIFLDDLLKRNYRLASIADRKYRFYGAAQQVTVVACVLWLSWLVLSQLR